MLRALAIDSGVVVRALDAGVASERDAPASGICRVRGRIWALLSSADPLERRIEILAEALRAQAGAALEERYLPPAARELLSRSRTTSGISLRVRRR